MRRSKHIGRDYGQADKNNNKSVIGTRFILYEQIYLAYNNNK